ncbi:hypothetical protein AZI85_08995 [Bdellovibrio bacteriovorus]|uniref:Solute-binding protein family 3/N-terminal domain-containing protein n=1 Tax=Bdellovibrio bacteriovorus TaxID=959 RepID=A0A150WDD5_BDEBC|nr:TIGR02285 family protein [Bdellovibrio bacteriovorus]KYG61084.1 hypothetical protein AZI85_08995 [Bdellovibrio bacteriovorus]
MKVLLALLIGLIINISYAQDTFVQRSNRPTVPWAVTDLPPFYVLSGPHAGEGRIDRIRVLIQKEIPELQFVDMNIGIGRAVELWKMNKEVCFGSALKTKERMRWAYFTVSAFQPGSELMLVTMNRALLETPAKKVSLKKLLRENRWKGFIPMERSYGENVDKIIKDNYVLVDAKESRTLTPDFGSILKVVAKKRYDFTIEYSSVVNAYNARNITEPALMMKPILESTGYVPLYFACTKNDWGRSVVQKVDQAMQKIAPTKEYQEAIEAWMEPQTLKKNHEALQEFYHRRAQGPWNTLNDE